MSHMLTILSYNITRLYGTKFFWSGNQIIQFIILFRIPRLTNQNRDLRAFDLVHICCIILHFTVQIIFI